MWGKNLRFFRAVLPLAATLVETGSKIFLPEILVISTSSTIRLLSERTVEVPRKLKSSKL